MTAETKRTEGMRAITLHRPWSFAVAHLGKDVENRGWRTNYRGLVAIHAGQRWNHDAEEYLDRVANRSIRSAGNVYDEGVVAVANLVDCHEAYYYGEFCCTHAWAQWTGWHWVLANVRPLPEPVPCKGRQGLWRLPKDVERAVWSALAGER